MLSKETSILLLSQLSK